MMNDKALRILSIGLGLLLLFHGIDKVMNGTAFIEKMLNGVHMPYSQYVSYGVYVGEVVAPLLLIFGKYIRISGAVIAFNMAVAIFLVHQKDIVTITEYGAWSIEVPMLYLIAGLSLAVWKIEPKATK
jgi:putative oxidoreductase